MWWPPVTAEWWEACLLVCQLMRVENGEVRHLLDTTTPAKVLNGWDVGDVGFASLSVRGLMRCIVWGQGRRWHEDSNEVVFGGKNVWQLQFNQIDVDVVEQKAVMEVELLRVSFYVRSIHEYQLKLYQWWLCSYFYDGLKRVKGEGLREGE